MIMRWFRIWKHTLDSNDSDEPIDFLVNALESGPQDSRKIMELASEHGLSTSQIYRLRKNAGYVNSFSHIWL